MHLASIFARDDRAGHWPNVAVGFADLAGNQQLIDSMCISFEQSLIHLAKGALLQTVSNSPLQKCSIAIGRRASVKLDPQGAEIVD